MFYTAAEQQQSRVAARLALAVSSDPLSCDWKRLGPIFPDKDGYQFTKSGALYVPNNSSTVAYLLYGDSTLVPGLQSATSSRDANGTFSTWTNNETIWLPIRTNYFDSVLVEAGPPPQLLSNPRYLLFVYNSARADANNTVNGLQYNVGWTIFFCFRSTLCRF